MPGNSFERRATKWANITPIPQSSILCLRLHPTDFAQTGHILFIRLRYECTGVFVLPYSSVSPVS